MEVSLHQQKRVSRLALPALLLVPTLALLIFQQRRFYPFFIDDSYISLVYVRNLLAGNGLTYNGMVVEGYSNFLWVLGVSLLSVLGLDPVVAAKTLGMLCSYGCLALLLRFGHQLTGRWRDGVLAGMLLAVSGPFIAWSVGGLEGCLFALLLTLLVYQLWREHQAGHVSRPWSAGLAVLLALTRPEGIALVGVVWGWLATLAALRRSRTSLRYLLMWTGVVALGFGTFLLWRILYYGDILPATVYAKRSALQDQINTGIVRLSPLLAEWRWALLALAAGFVGLLVSLWRQRALVALVGMVLAAYTAFIIASGADWMPMHRFLVPLFPLALLVLVAGLSALVAKLLSATKSVWHLPLLLLLLAAPAGQLALWTESRRDEAIQVANSTWREPAALGNHLRSIATPETSIAVLDAGAIAYYSGVPVLDLYGLNNQHIAHLPGTFGTRFDKDYIFAFAPTFIELHHWLTKEGNPVFMNYGGANRLYYSQEFQRWYERDPTLPIAPFRRLQTPRPITMMDNFYTARMQFVSPTPSLAPGARVRVPLSLTNNGSGRWIGQGGLVEGAVYLVAKVQSADGSQTLTEQWTPIPEDMGSGETHTVELGVVTPAQAGQYALTVDLVLNGVHRFSEQGFAPLRQALVVQQ